MELPTVDPDSSMVDVPPSPVKPPMNDSFVSFTPGAALLQLPASERTATSILDSIGMQFGDLRMVTEERRTVLTCNIGA